MEAPHRSGEKRRQDDHDRGYGRDDDRNRQRHHRLSTASSSTSSSSRHTGGYRGEGRDYDERRAERDNRDAPRRELLDNGRRSEPDRVNLPDRDLRSSNDRARSKDSWKPDSRSREHKGDQLDRDTTASYRAEGPGATSLGASARDTPRTVVKIKGVSDASTGREKLEERHLSPQGSPPGEGGSRPPRPHQVFVAARAAAEGVSARTSSRPDHTSNNGRDERDRMKERSREEERYERSRVTDRRGSGDAQRQQGRISRSPDDGRRRYGEPSRDHRDQRDEMDSYRSSRSSRDMSPRDSRRDRPSGDRRTTDSWTRSEVRYRSRSPRPLREQTAMSPPAHTRDRRDDARGNNYRDNRDRERLDRPNGREARRNDREPDTSRDSGFDSQSSASLSIRSSHAQEYEGGRRRSPSVSSGQLSPPKKLRRLPEAFPKQDQAEKTSPAVSTAREPSQTASEPKRNGLSEATPKLELAAPAVKQEIARSPSPQAPPPTAEPEPVPPPPVVEKQASAAVRRRREIRAKLKPLRDRIFVGCSEASAYEKVDESKGGLLGMGTFGEVSRARHILSGQEVALKKIKIQVTESHNGMPITAIREIKLLKKLSHPNVCPVVDMVYEPPSETSTGSGTVYMVLPYMEHDLNGLIERLDSEDKPFTPAQIKLYAKQLFEGTLYLHQNKILHRDIKAANILISNDGSLRIADFGLARPYHDPGAVSGRPAWRMTEKGQPGWEGGDVNYTGMVVTRWYRPPELLAGERRYGPAVDMWGLGCLLAEMIVRRPMFKGSSEINQLELIVDLCGSPGEDCYPGWTSLPGVKNVDNTGQVKADKNEKGRHDFGKKPRCVREKFMGMVRSELADLIDRLLVLDPRKRLTAEGALAHKWFDVEPLPADPASLPYYPDSKEATKGQKGAAHRKALQQQQHHLQPSQRASMGPGVGGGPSQQVYMGGGGAGGPMGYVNPAMIMRPNGTMAMGMPAANVIGGMPSGMSSAPGHGHGPGPHHRGYPPYAGPPPSGMSLGMGPGMGMGGGGGMRSAHHQQQPYPHPHPHHMMGDPNGGAGAHRGGGPPGSDWQYRSNGRPGGGGNPYQRNSGADWGGGGGGGGRY